VLRVNFLPLSCSESFSPLRFYSYTSLDAARSVPASFLASCLYCNLSIVCHLFFSTLKQLTLLNTCAAFLSLPLRKYEFRMSFANARSSKCPLGRRYIIL